MVSVQIARLRNETAADHAAVETGLPLTRNDLDLEGYRHTLERLYPLVSTWECFAEQASPFDLVDLITTRARRQLLAADLEVLGGVAAMQEPVVLPIFSSRAALLGALYVMEGSRLGGQIITRHITDRLQLGDGVAVTYFRGFGQRTGFLWKELVAILEAIPEEDAEITIAAAKAMFATFGAWMSPPLRTHSLLKTRMEQNG